MSKIRNGKSNPRMMYGSMGGSIQSNSCIPPTCRCPGGGCLTRCCGTPVNPSWPVASYEGHGEGTDNPYAIIDCTHHCAQPSGDYQGPPSPGEYNQCFKTCSQMFSGHTII